MLDQGIIIRKFKKQKEYLADLKVYADITYEDFMNSRVIQLAIERLIQLIAEVALDVNRHIFKSLKLKQPDENADTFIKLSQLNIIDSNLAKKLKESGKMRNLLVHLYEKIEPQIVHSAIKETLTDYPLYQRQILNYLDSLEEKK